MRAIKFRGERLNGKIIFGDLLHKHSATQIAVTHVVTFNVKKDTVAQLCGLDKNGREIYDRPNFLATLSLKENAHD